MWNGQFDAEATFPGASMSRNVRSSAVKVSSSSISSGCHCSSLKRVIDLISKIDKKEQSEVNRNQSGKAAHRHFQSLINVHRHGGDGAIFQQCGILSQCVDDCCKLQNQDLHEIDSNV
jgi:hypothetical protein